jgi:hypothetical protein
MGGGLPAAFIIKTPEQKSIGSFKVSFDRSDDLEFNSTNIYSKECIT